MFAWFVTINSDTFSLLSLYLVRLKGVRAIIIGVVLCLAASRNSDGFCSRTPTYTSTRYVCSISFGRQHYTLHVIATHIQSPLDIPSSYHLAKYIEFNLDEQSQIYFRKPWPKALLFHLPPSLLNQHAVGDSGV